MTLGLKAALASEGGTAVTQRLRLGRVPLLMFALIMVSAQAFAGVTGKVSGTVVNEQNEEPVMGATVRVLGTDLVATTDEEGEYFIINVPSGKYDVSVTHVGYGSVTKKDVRVLLDLTSPVDFGLRQMAVELKREMVVYATEPPVQKDLTASKVIFTSDRLRNLPNVVNIQSVLFNYPGVVQDRDKDLHVRGGRAGQVAFFYDGFSVMDPFTANTGIRIMPSALEELSLTSGGFTAEYGEALSGVVSAVTPEGGSNYHGRIRAYQGATHAYDVISGDWNSLDFNANRSVSFNFSGPVPGLDSKRYTFFAAGEYLRDNGYLPHNSGVGYSGTAKLSAQPMPRLKLTANVKYYDSWGDLYTHRDVNGRSYDFNLDGLPSYEKNAYLGGFSGNYAITDYSVLSTSISRFKTNTLIAPSHLLDKHWSEWPGYSEDAEGNYDGTIHRDNYLNDADYSDPYEATGFATGDDFNPRYSWREAAYNAFATSYLSQINKRNQVKIGFDYTRYEVEWDAKQFYNSKPYGEIYTSNPVYMSAFAQDKIEYDDFIINLGLRWDYRNADISYNVTPDTVASYREAKSQTRVSPRLGVSFPITDKSVMHFNYGLYYQAPQYSYMYTNLDGDLNSGLPLLGNPDLAPEQTVAYELGLDHMINDGLRIDLTAYYKDIKDLVTTRKALADHPSYRATRFLNGDYGAVKGLDIAVDKLANGSFFSASVAYSYMIATGNGSDALDPYYTYLYSTEDSLPPMKEYSLDFDQRHTVTATLDIRMPADWRGKVFGMIVPGGWGINVKGYYGSGLPYTKADAMGNRFGERNEGRLPANHTVDMRFNKDFRLGAQRQLLSFFVEVDNLFNRRNVLDVYAYTGQPDTDNRRAQGGLSTNQQELDRLDRLYDHDPQNFSSPRTIRTGVEFGF